jgi:hypothetical protein
LAEVASVTMPFTRGGREVGAIRKPSARAGIWLLRACQRVEVGCLGKLREH